ncbi:MAG: radical SAM protein [Desulfobacterium sp.]|jgi:histone acetyltransferase (RNA polymerase elongator complex component)|nr:radical SAM protein [Desulfobacterium sp.]
MARLSKPLVIPIFIPHQGCPHKCAFCDQSIITSKRAALPDKNTICRQVETWLAYRGDRSSVELAFFGGNFLGLAPRKTETLLEIAQNLIREEKIQSIRCSTRPDTIHEKSLDLAKRFSLDTVEIGVQSMDDQVLAKARRGHTARDTAMAAKLLDRDRIKKGMQMMVGLPGDTDAKAIETARKIADLNPAFVRIYPLMVLKNSLVHRWYTRGEYTPMALDHCVELVASIHALFTRDNIPVIRMGLQASDLLQDREIMVAGPWHPAFGHLVLSRLMLDRATKMLDQMLGQPPDLKKNPQATKKTRVTLRVHPSTQSRLRGDRNNNLAVLTTRYPWVEIKIESDPSVAVDQLGGLAM